MAVEGAVSVTVVVAVAVGCAARVEEPVVGPAATTLAAATWSCSVPGDRYLPRPSCTPMRPAMPRANPAPTVTPRRTHQLNGVFSGAGSACSTATLSAGVGSKPARLRLASRIAAARLRCTELLIVVAVTAATMLPTAAPATVPLTPSRPPMTAATAADPAPARRLTGWSGESAARAFPVVGDWGSSLICLWDKVGIR